MEVADQAVAFGIYQRPVGTALTAVVLEACVSPQKARRLEALAASCYGSTRAAVGGSEALCCEVHALRFVSLARRAAMCPSPGLVFFSATNHHLGCEAVRLWEVCFRNPSDREAVPWRGPESSGSE
jgi:hypothetical protein